MSQTQSTESAIAPASSAAAELPEEALALIGVKKTRRVTVTARDIKRFAQAIGERNPIHYDEDYARCSRHGTIVAPPLFCQTLTFDDVSPSELAPDGSPVELNVPLPAQRAMGGGSEYTVYRLVRAGETITVTSQLKNLYTKQGKNGLLYFIVVETSFADERDETVAVEVATYIKRI
jgi:acyl dehydratase